MPGIARPAHCGFSTIENELFGTTLVSSYPGPAPAGGMRRSDAPVWRGTAPSAGRRAAVERAVGGREPDHDRPRVASSIVIPVIVFAGAVAYLFGSDHEVGQLRGRGALVDAQVALTVHGSPPPSPAGRSRTPACCAGSRHTWSRCQARSASTRRARECSFAPLPLCEYVVRPV